MSDTLPHTVSTAPWDPEAEDRLTPEQIGRASCRERV